MPELPEVHTTVSGINKYIKGLTIKDVWTEYNSPYYIGKDNIKNPKFFSIFKNAVIGQKVISAKRRAKNILINLTGGHTVLIHMKMTGHVMHGKYGFNPKGEKNSGKDKWFALEDGPLKDSFNKFLRLVFTLSDGKHLVLSDMRKFAKVTIIKTAVMAESEHLKNLGPEPLEKNFTIKKFTEQLNKKPKGKIKTVLMEQSLISGIGNIYSDEILWRAGVHPEELVHNISEEKLEKMFKAMKETLKRGIDFGGDSMSDYRNILGEKGKFQEHHEAYRRIGQKCNKPVCKGKIIKKKVGGRSAHFCDTHQKLSKIK